MFFDGFGQLADLAFGRKQLERPYGVRKRAEPKHPREEDVPATAVSEIAICGNRRPRGKRARCLTAHAIRGPTEKPGGREHGTTDLHLADRLAGCINVA